MYGRILDLPDGIVNDVCTLAQQMPYNPKLALSNPVFRFLSNLRDAIGSAVYTQTMRQRELVTEQPRTPNERAATREVK